LITQSGAGSAAAAALRAKTKRIRTFSWCRKPAIGLMVRIWSEGLR
jgi:hypothetical protein